MEFSRPEYWSGLPFPSPGDLPNPGIEPRFPAMQAVSLPTELSGREALIAAEMIEIHTRGCQGKKNHLFLLAIDMLSVLSHSPRHDTVHWSQKDNVVGLALP